MFITFHTSALWYSFSILIGQKQLYKTAVQRQITGLILYVIVSVVTAHVLKRGKADPLRNLHKDELKTVKKGCFFHFNENKTYNR